MLMTYFWMLENVTVIIKFDIRNRFQNFSIADDKLKYKMCLNHCQNLNMKHKIGQLIW